MIYTPVSHVSTATAALLETGRRDRNGLEILTEAECWDLLRQHELGRVGLCDGGSPEVLPVNYVVDDDTILVRTGTGSLLRAAVANAIVVLETDGTDRFDDAPWSVIVRGIAKELPATEPGEEDRLRCWGRCAPSRLVRIHHCEITGRRLHRQRTLTSSQPAAS